MPIDLEAIRKKRAYNKMLESMKNLMIETPSGAITSSKMKFCRYKTRDAILRLHDLHNKSLNRLTINDLQHLNQYDCSNLYRNLNMSLNIQLVTRDKLFVTDFIDELNNVTKALKSFDGLESVLLTSVSRSKELNLISLGEVDLIINMEKIPFSANIAAGHSFSFYYNSHTSDWRNFTANNLSGFREQLMNNMNNWNGLGSAISKPDCLKTMKYTFGVMGASWGFTLGAISGGPAGAIVGGFNGYVAGSKVGEVIGEGGCEDLPSDTTQVDSNTNTDDNPAAALTKEDVERIKKETEEKRKEDGCFVDPESDFMFIENNEFLLDGFVETYYVKGAGLDSLISNIDGKYNIKDMPYFRNDGVNDNQINIHLGFLNIIPNLNNSISEFIIDIEPFSNIGSIDSNPITLDLLKSNSDSIFLKNGEVLDSTSDIINVFKERIENESEFEGTDVIQTGHNPTVAYTYVIDERMIDNAVEENHTMNVIFIKSPSLRRMIGDSVTVSGLALQDALDEIRKMERWAAHADAITNFGSDNI